jgi:PHD/YefM family antitoxin component YafN of YafNO toxin-antitoxin module
MKTIELGEATSPLADYIEGVQMEPLVVTDRGTPTAVILPLIGDDLETVSLSTNPDFIALIERSRASSRVEGGLSSAEMRRRVLGSK